MSNGYKLFDPEAAQLSPADLEIIQKEVGAELSKFDIKPYNFEYLQKLCRADLFETLQENYEQAGREKERAAATVAAKQKGLALLTIQSEQKKQQIQSELERKQAAHESKLREYKAANQRHLDEIKQSLHLVRTDYEQRRKWENYQNNVREHIRKNRIQPLSGGLTHGVLPDSVFPPTRDWLEQRRQEEIGKIVMFLMAKQASMNLRKGKVDATREYYNSILLKYLVLKMEAKGMADKELTKVQLEIGEAMKSGGDLKSILEGLKTKKLLTEKQIEKVLQVSNILNSDINYEVMKARLNLIKEKQKNKRWTSSDTTSLDFLMSDPEMPILEEYRGLYEERDPEKEVTPPDPRVAAFQDYQMKLGGHEFTLDNEHQRIRTQKTSENKIAEMMTRLILQAKRDDSNEFNKLLTFLSKIKIKWKDYKNKYKDPQKYQEAIDRLKEEDLSQRQLEDIMQIGKEADLLSIAERSKLQTQYSNVALNDKVEVFQLGCYLSQLIPKDDPTISERVMRYLERLKLDSTIGVPEAKLASIGSSLTEAVILACDPNACADSADVLMRKLQISVDTGELTEEEKRAVEVHVEALRNFSTRAVLNEAQQRHVQDLQKLVDTDKSANQLIQDLKNFEYSGSDSIGRRSRAIEDSLDVAVRKEADRLAQKPREDIIQLEREVAQAKALVDAKEKELSDHNQRKKTPQEEENIRKLDQAQNDLQQKTREETEAKALIDQAKTEPQRQETRLAQTYAHQLIMAADIYLRTEKSRLWHGKTGEKRAKDLKNALVTLLNDENITVQAVNEKFLDLLKKSPLRNRSLGTIALEVLYNEGNPKGLFQVQLHEASQQIEAKHHGTLQQVAAWFKDALTRSGCPDPNDTFKAPGKPKKEQDVTWSGAVKDFLQKERQFLKNHRTGIRDRAVRNLEKLEKCFVPIHQEIVVEQIRSGLTRSPTSGG